MKTNMDYLREFIEDNNKAIEFWDTVSKEISNDKLHIKSLKETVIEKDKLLLESIDDMLECEQELESIRCGIGEILYKQPENLALQSYMDNFKEKTENKFLLPA